MVLHYATAESERSPPPQRSVRWVAARSSFKRISTIWVRLLHRHSWLQRGRRPPGGGGQGAVGPLGEKREIARLAAFLCSDDAAFIVGQTIVADGGTTALMSLISDFRNPSSASFGKGYVPGV